MADKLNDLLRNLSCLSDDVLIEVEKLKKGTNSKEEIQLFQRQVENFSQELEKTALMRQQMLLKIPLRSSHLTAKNKT